MSVHEAFLGVTVDHLYHNCPALQRSINAGTTWQGQWKMGDKARGTVDPMGSDVCGWCRSVYIAKRMP